MIRVIPKYRVVYNFTTGPCIEMFMHDDFYNNILRKAADINFDFSREVSSITIELIKNQQSGTSVINN